jgi:CHAT domain-containing protein
MIRIVYLIFIVFLINTIWGSPAFGQSCSANLDSSNYYQKLDDYQTARVWSKKAVDEVESKNMQNDTCYLSAYEDYLGCLVNLCIQIQDKSILNESQFIGDKMEREFSKFYSIEIKRYYNLQMLRMIIYNYKNNLDSVKTINLKIYNYLKDKNSNEFHEMIYNMANLSYHMGIYYVADTLINRYLYINNRDYDTNSVKYANNILTAGEVLLKLKKTGIALEQLKKAESIYLDNDTVDYKKLVKCYYSLFNIYLNKSNFNDAEYYIGEIINLLKTKATSKFQEVIDAKMNLIGLYKKQGKLEQVEDGLKDIIDSYFLITGTKDLNYYKHLKDLAFFYAENNHITQASKIISDIDSIMENNNSDKSLKMNYFVTMMKLYRAIENQKKTKYYIHKWLECTSDSSVFLGWHIIGLYGYAQWLFEKGQTEKADSIYKYIIDVVQNKNKDLNNLYFTIIQDYAPRLFSMGDLTRAEKFTKELLDYELKTNGKRSEGYLKALKNLEVMYLTQNKLSEALETLNQLYENERDSSSIIMQLNQQSDIMLKANEFLKADSLNKEMLDRIYKLAESDNPNSINMLIVVAQYLVVSGKAREAEALYKKINSKIKTQKSINSGIYLKLQELASKFMNYTYFSTAESIYKSMESHLAKLYDKLPYIQLVSDLAFIYRMLFQFELSEKYFKLALDTTKEYYGENSVLYSSILNNYSLLMRAYYKNTEAGKLAREAFDIVKENKEEDDLDYIKKYENFADAVCTDNGIDSSLYLYNLIDSLRKKYGFITKNSSYDYFLNSYSILLYDAGNYRKAEKMNAFVCDLASNELKQNNFAKVPYLNNRAMMLYAVGNIDSASKFYLLSNNAYKRIFEHTLPFLSENQKKNFIDKNSVYFERFNEFALLNNEKFPNLLGEVYNTSLYTKKIILNSNRKFKKRLQESADPETQKLYRRWNFLQDRMGSSFASGNSDTLYNYVKNIEEKLYSKLDLSSIDDLKFDKTYKQIAAKLKQDEAAVEIIRFRKSNGRRWTDTIYYAALIVKSDLTIELALLSYGNLLESNYYKRYKKFIGLKIEDRESYGYYWKGIASKLNGINKVYLSPDGIFNQVNLQTLLNPETGRYLIEETDIQTVGSTKDILYTSAPNTNQYDKKAVLIGNPDFNLNINSQDMETEPDEPKLAYNEELREIAGDGIKPLPGTEKEINTINGMFRKTGRNWEILKYTDSLALEENLKQVDNPYILHIATHGKFMKDEDVETLSEGSQKKRNYEHPLLRSFLLLAGSGNTLKNNFSGKGSSESDNGNDGIFTAYEAQVLNLDKTELVVLSACETGLGEVRTSEGVYGLQRAFIQAGAKTLIMSLWSVDDNATQELMTNFYKKWLSGKSKREAFKEAQLELKNTYPQPFYWGAFVMVGE